MDDIIIWANNAQELNTILQASELFLETKLQLALKTKYINTTEHGLNFLSYRIFNKNVPEIRQFYFLATVALDKIPARK